MTSHHDFFLNKRKRVENWNKILMSCDAYNIVWYISSSVLKNSNGSNLI
jgi:hypothetical protein